MEGKETNMKYCRSGINIIWQLVIIKGKSEKSLTNLKLRNWVTHRIVVPVRAEGPWSGCSVMGKCKMVIEPFSGSGLGLEKY